MGLGLGLGLRLGSGSGLGLDHLARPADDLARIHLVHLWRSGISVRVRGRVKGRCRVKGRGRVRADGGVALEWQSASAFLHLHVGPEMPAVRDPGSCEQGRRVLGHVLPAKRVVVTG